MMTRGILMDLCLSAEAAGVLPSMDELVRHLAFLLQDLPIRLNSQARMPVSKEPPESPLTQAAERPPTVEKTNTQ